MKLLSHGPEPCASANSAISANIKLSNKTQMNEKLRLPAQNIVVSLVLRADS